MAAPADIQWALAQLLLVCADEVWARRARDVLRNEGFDVDVEHDRAHVMSRISSVRPDVVGVDLSFPSGYGVALCATLRSRERVSIFAVGPRASEAAVLAALAAGADAYVPKEASPREFVARVRALLRRFPPTAHPAGAPLTCGPVMFDPVHRRASIAGEPVHLGDIGLDLLEALLRKPGRVVSRAELLSACGAGANDGRVLELHVRRLRDRLEAATTKRWISAVRGVGFRFEPDANQ